MHEEFLILLETDLVEAQPNKQGNSRLSHLIEVFRSRITIFYATHPEVDEVPEGELPHLFYMKKDPESTPKETSNSVALSHVSPLFKRRFSPRACSASVPEEFSVNPSPCLLKTPVKDTSITTNVEDEPLSNIKGTPTEAVSTPSKLMVDTPALCPPKRSVLSPDHGDELPTKSTKLRSLAFDGNNDQPIHVHGDNNVHGYSVSKDVLKVLPSDLVDSLMDKERKILKEQDPVVSQTTDKLIAGVPKLFNMICLLFQSIGHSVITRQELIQKIISGHLDIIDREHDDQLKLLLEIAPECLSELQSLSGDTLLRLNKQSCFNSIRAKLLEAK